MSPIPSPLLLLALACVQLPAVAQESPEGAPESRPQGAESRPDDALLTYPRDKSRVMAVVHGRNVTLEDIVSHIDSRHCPDFATYVSTKVGQFEIRSPRMAEWTRQFADITALRAAARERSIAETKILEALGAVYTRQFAKFREAYEEQNGRPFPTSENAIRALRQNFQKRRGLGMEVEGLLDVLVPGNYTGPEVHDFFKHHHTEMTGFVTISHILVRTRDARTGELFRGERMAKARADIRRIEEMLARDGSNFEDIAAERSEDRTTATKGGVLENLRRFDPRLPAVLCRTAWRMKDGEWTGPIESRFGQHFVKRIKWTIVSTIINPDYRNPDVQKFVRSHHQEDLLFRLREEAAIDLRY